MTHKEHRNEDEIGKIRTMAVSQFKNLSQLVCGDKCGFLWIFDTNSFKLLDIKEAHEDQIVQVIFCPIDDLEDE